MKEIKSKYPVRDGYIFLLNGVRTVYNKHAKSRLDHLVVVWVLRIFRKQGRKRKQDRKVCVHFFYVPVPLLDNNHCLARTKPVTFRYLAKLLAQGYSVIDDQTRWYYNRWSAKRFYVKTQERIGVRFF